MRRTISFAVFGILAAATATVAAPAAPAKADAASARAYLQGIYDRYEHEELFGVFGAGQTKFFDASTLALLRQDQKVLNGDEGAIDADYMCVCQDPAGMHATIGDVAMTGANAARAQVSIQFMAEANKPIAHVVIDLTFEKGAWRIHDLHAKDPEGNTWPGMRDALTKEIAELSAHH